MNSSSFIAKILKTYANRLLAMVFGFVATIAIARTLGPEGRGWIATATTLAGIGTILSSLGLPQVNAYYGAKEPKLRSALLGNSLLMSVLVTLGLAVIFYLSYWLYPNFINLPGAFLPLTIMYAGLQLAITLIQQLLISMDLVRYYNYSELAVRGLQLLGIIVLAMYGQRQAVGYFASSTIAFIPVIAVCAYLCTRHIGSYPRCSFTLLRDTTNYSFRLYLIAVCYNTYMGLDILMTQMYIGVDQAGIFSIAASMRQVLLVMTLVVQTLLLPRLVQLATNKERVQMSIKYSVLTLGATSVISIATYFIAAYLIGLVFGAEFLPAVSVVNWILPGYIIYSATAILAIPLQIDGQPWYSVMPMVITLLTHLAFCTYFIPRSGLVGGAQAFTVAAAVYLITQITAMRFYARSYRSSN